MEMDGRSTKNMDPDNDVRIDIIFIKTKRPADWQAGCCAAGRWRKNKKACRLAGLSYPKSC